MVWILAITGVLGVFSGLLLLCIFLLIVQKIAISEWRKKKKEDVFNFKTSGKISGEVAAAVAVSIYLNVRSFKEQEKLLTIQKVTKPFSPWINSGKIQMITEWNEVYNRKKQL